MSLLRVLVFCWVKTEARVGWHEGSFVDVFVKERDKWFIGQCERVENSEENSDECLTINWESHVMPEGEEEAPQGTVTLSRLSLGVRQVPTVEVSVWLFQSSLSVFYVAENVLYLWNVIEEAA